MARTSQSSTRFLNVAVWCGLVSALVFMGFWVWMRRTSALNPPEGWQQIPIEQRYEMMAGQFRIALDLLPVAAFLFAIIAFLVWRHGGKR